ncbi:hypothetical protein SLEP1_g3170 [Rubroshorea leprosula]|uniref:Uncharacterized protein n=1 Tax=Rubroshorea leprosula TaxID=152421 RepID=A0AAV5HQ91_9ROSI|nr:hypothetical protein SLEP1_g3170 [Rubroshorea leprosula]
MKICHSGCSWPLRYAAIAAAMAAIDNTVCNYAMS